jgi:hypothetical protein
MALLTRDEILNADDRKLEEVHVPEWGGSVMVRTLSGKERDEYESGIVSVKDGKSVQNYENIRARLVALCVVDDKGTRLFNKSDVTALGNKSVAALQRVFNKCQELNAISDDDVEELVEDFSNGPGESSTSD